MYNVTDRRMEKARNILDEYKRILEERGTFQTGMLESSLRDVWNTGYQEIKSAMIDLYKNHLEYSALAEYYMRNQAPRGMMVSEFKKVLMPLQIN